MSGWKLRPRNPKKPDLSFSYSKKMRGPSTKSRAGRLFVSYRNARLTGWPESHTRVSRSTARLRLTGWRKVNRYGEKIDLPSRAVVKFRDRWSGKRRTLVFKKPNKFDVWSKAPTWAAVTGNRQKVRIPPDISKSGIRLAVRGWQLPASHKYRPSVYFRFNTPLRGPTTKYRNGTVYTYFRSNSNRLSKHRLSRGTARIKFTGWKKIHPRGGYYMGYWMPSKAIVHLRRPYRGWVTYRFRDKGRSGVWQNNMRWDGPDGGNRPVS